jgi:predicted O-methyltransferase YrrM/PAS domain-containing protein
MTFLNQATQLIRFKMQGLWIGVTLSFLLLIYGLSSLPGHELIAIIAILPLVIVWRKQFNKWRSENSSLRSEIVTLQAEIATLQSTKKELEAQNSLLVKNVTVESSRLAKLLSSISDGVAITDTKSVIVYVNPIFEKLINKQASALIGHTYRAFFKDENLNQAINKVLHSKDFSSTQIPTVALKHISTISVNGIWEQDSSLGAIIMLHSNDPFHYKNRHSPFPRPRSTVGLGEVLGWFFPTETLRPATPYINIVVHKCRNEPEYFGSMGAAGSSEPETGEALYTLIRLLRPKNVIEIGAYTGASSISMAQALVDNADEGILHSIEVNSTHLALAQKHLLEACLEKHVMFYHGQSNDPEIIHALPKSEVIFVDGDHTYEGAKQDFEIYSRLLAEDGVMVYHDTIKIMALQQLMNEIAQNPDYDIFTLATSDGDGITLIRKRLI